MSTRHRFIGFALAATFLTAAPACVATLTTRPSRSRDYGREAQRRAYENGYSLGLEKGRSDGRKGDRPDVERYKEFRNGDKGYHGRDGDRREYRDAFRNGFSAGYGEAYRSNARNGDRDDDRDDRGRRR